MDFNKTAIKTIHKREMILRENKGKVLDRLERGNNEEDSKSSIKDKKHKHNPNHR